MPRKIQHKKYQKTGGIKPNGSRDKKFQKFVSMLNENPNVSQVSAACGLSRMEVYARRSVDEQFRKEWDEARDIGMCRLEDEAYNRAMNGEEPSDRLLMFMLQHNQKRKYGKPDDSEKVLQTSALLSVTQGGDLYVHLRSQICAHLTD